VNGVQHPAPLKCLVDRTPDGISVTAQYALLTGRNVTSKPPKTEIWCMLYAQVKQADAVQNRNILLSEARAQFVESQQFNPATFLVERSSLPANSFDVNLDAPAMGVAAWLEGDIEQLDQFNLAHTTGLSVLAVEMLARYGQYVLFGPAPDTSVRPLGQQLGRYRILRASPLVAAPEIC
jgi:hypothetical protein